MKKVWFVKKSIVSSLFEVLFAGLLYAQEKSDDIKSVPEEEKVLEEGAGAEVPSDLPAEKSEKKGKSK